MESVKEIARRVRSEIEAAAKENRKTKVSVPHKALKRVKHELARRAHIAVGYIDKTPVALELQHAVRAQLAEQHAAGGHITGSVPQRIAAMLDKNASRARNARRNDRKKTAKKLHAGRASGDRP